MEAGGRHPKTSSHTETKRSRKPRGGGEGRSKGDTSRQARVRQGREDPAARRHTSVAMAGTAEGGEGDRGYGVGGDRTREAEERGRGGRGRGIAAVIVLRNENRANKWAS